MQRLKAAEESIDVCEGVIDSERSIRKNTSMELKGEIN